MSDASCGAAAAPYKQLIAAAAPFPGSAERIRLAGGQAEGSFRSPPSEAAAASGWQNFIVPGPPPLDAVLEPGGRHRHHEQRSGYGGGPVAAPPLVRNAPAATDTSQWASGFMIQPARHPHQAPLPAAAARSANRPVAPAPAIGTSMGLFGGQLLGNGPIRHATGVPDRTLAQAEFDWEMDRWMMSHGAAEVTAPRAQNETLAERGQAEKGHVWLPAATDSQQRAGVASHLASPLATTIPHAGQDRTRGATANPSEDANREQEDPTERSAIAEIAQNLLESVRQEDGSKWKNSQFLALMRDFRDGRKDIVGSDICEVAADGGQTARPDGDHA